MSRAKARVSRGVAAANVAEPLDRLREAVHRSEAVLDGGDHQVLDVLGGDAARRRHMPHCLAITAVERERGAHLLAIVAADLEGVGTPAGVALVGGDPAIVAPLLRVSAVTLEQDPDGPPFPWTRV